MLMNAFARSLLVIPVLASAAMFSDTVSAAGCPPAGARYVSDNFVRVSHLVSLGGEFDDTLGCQWKREDDGKIIWKNPNDASMKPLAQASATSESGNPASGNDADASTGAIPAGVYACDMPINVGGMIQGTPATGAMFGVTGSDTYRDFDGGTGHFTLQGNILVMTDGPLEGTRYQRKSETVFKPLDEAGKAGSIVCRLNRKKSLTGRW